MKNKNIFIYVILAVILSGAGIVSFKHFYARGLNFKDPEWVSSIVDAPAISNEKDLDDLWMSVPRCCSEEKVVSNNKIFYKSCSNAIKNTGDENVIVKCLWLMPIAVDYSEKPVFEKLILENYYDHRDSLANCANCNYGDTVSRTAKDLASYYVSEKQYDLAAATLENVLDKRGSDTSPWIKLEILTDLGNIYLNSSISDAGKQRMKAAYEEFEAKKQEQTITSRIHDFELVYNKIFKSN